MSIVDGRTHDFADLPARILLSKQYGVLSATIVGVLALMIRNLALDLSPDERVCPKNLCVLNLYGRDLNFGGIKDHCLGEQHLAKLDMT